MRKVFAVISVVFLCSAAALAEPLALQQAKNVLEPGMLELGFGDLNYQTDVTKFTDGTQLTRTATITSLYSRYSFSGCVEGSINIPYLSLSSKTESSGSPVTADDSGLGDPVLSFKYVINDSGLESAAGVGISIPVGKQSDKFPESFRNGVSFKPEFVLSKNLEKYIINLNLSYELTGEYEDASAAKTKQNPGDIISLGVGVEYPKWENTSLIGEFVYNNILQASTAGSSVSGSSGSQMDLICGLRYNKNSFRTKLGIDLSLGDEQFRDYDYRIIAGITYLWKI